VLVQAASSFARHVCTENNDLVPKSDKIPHNTGSIDGSFMNIIRRPVLAMSVIGDSNSRISGHPLSQRSANSAQPENASVTVSNLYVGASAELVRGIHHHSARTRIAPPRHRLFLYNRIQQQGWLLHTITIRLSSITTTNKSLGRNQFQSGPGSKRPSPEAGSPQSSTLNRPLRQFAAALLRLFRYS